VRPAVGVRIVVAAVGPADGDQPADVTGVGPSPTRLQGRHIRAGRHLALAPADEVDLGDAQLRLDDRDRVADDLRLHQVLTLLVREADGEDAVSTPRQILHQPGGWAGQGAAAVAARLTRIGPGAVRGVVRAMDEQDRCGVGPGVPAGGRVEQEAAGVRARDAAEVGHPLAVLVTAAVRRVALGAEPGGGVEVTLHALPAVGDDTGPVGCLESEIRRRLGGVRGAAGGRQSGHHRHQEGEQKPPPARTAMSVPHVLSPLPTCARRSSVRRHVRQRRHGTAYVGTP
jgi:hypothetical protein